MGVYSYKKEEESIGGNGFFFYAGEEKRKAVAFFKLSLFLEMSKKGGKESSVLKRSNAFYSLASYHIMWDDFSGSNPIL